jgi:HEAT repeat protein
MHNYYVKMTSFEQVRKIVESGSKEQKIKLLESLSDEGDAKIVSLIVSELDDADIEVRGEAFSSLVMNQNDISNILIESLKSPSKNIRGFSSLVLANRNDRRTIPKISQLTDDESAMVRSCAVGALGYLKANEACLAIRKCLDDSNIDVKKSAIKSAIDIGDKNLLTKIDELSKEDDPEINTLIILAKNKL